MALEATDWVKSIIYLDLVQTKKPSTTQGKSRDLTKAFNERFPETELDVYTDMEVNYNASILKIKAQNEGEAKQNQDEVRKVFNKALRTLKSKMNELLLTKAFYSISEKYKEQAKDLNIIGKSDISKQLHNNAVKLLLRSKKMVEAKIMVSKILKSIIKREELRDQMLSLLDSSASKEDRDNEPLLRLYQDLLILSSRILKDIALLVEEHRILKRPFIFNKQDYGQQIHEQMLYFRDYLSHHFALKVSQELDKHG
jgi:hypothetical protein